MLHYSFIIYLFIYVLPTSLYEFKLANLPSTSSELSDEMDSVITTTGSESLFRYASIIIL